MHLRQEPEDIAGKLLALRSEVSAPLSYYWEH